MSGKVFLIGAGPGAPDLITLRGWRLLNQADVVLYDALIDPRMLEGVSARKIYVGKRCGRHALKQEQINQLLVDLALEGNNVARLKGGDPTLFGRGGEEALELAAAGVEVEMIPGVCSAVAGPELVGIPVTHRGVADSVVVITAHPRSDGRPFSIPPYNPSTTVVLMMGVTSVAAWQESMQALGYPPELPIAFVSEASRPAQRAVIGTLREASQLIYQHQVRPPAVAVIGEVVRLHAELGETEPHVEETRVADSDEAATPAGSGARPPHFPALLNLEGRTVVVIGGGRVARSRVRGLLECGARVRVVTLDACKRLQALARERRIELVLKAFEPADLDDAFIVVAATNDSAVNAEVFAAGEARGLLVNGVDDPARCNFIVPAVVRRGDLTLTACTGGSSPALSARVRERLESLFGPEYGEMAELLRSLRSEVMQRFPDPAERKELWYRLVDSDLLDLVHRGQKERAWEHAMEMIAQAEAAPVAGS